MREGAGGDKKASRASEKHLFLSFSDEGSFDMLRARTDTGIIGLTSQFTIVPVGSEATRKETFFSENCHYSSKRQESKSMYRVSEPTVGLAAPRRSITAINDGEHQKKHTIIY